MFKNVNDLDGLLKLSEDNPNINVDLWKDWYVSVSVTNWDRWDLIICPVKDVVSKIKWINPKDDL